MPPNTDVTTSAPYQLIEDLEQLADVRGSDRSTEFCVAAMVWVNAAIEDGTLNRAEKWDPQAYFDRRKVA